MALAKELGRHYASWVTLNQASFVTAFYVETISWSCGDRSWRISLLRGGFRGKEPLFVFVLFCLDVVYVGCCGVIVDGWMYVVVTEVLLVVAVSRCSSWFPTKARFDTPFCVGFFPLGLIHTLLARLLFFLLLWIFFSCLFSCWFDLFLGSLGVVVSVCGGARKKEMR